MNYDDDYENNYTDNDEGKFKRGIIIFLVIVTFISIISFIIAFYKISKIEEKYEQLETQMQTHNKESKSSIDKLTSDVEELKLENKKLSLAILKDELNACGIRILGDTAKINYSLFTTNKGDDSTLTLLKNSGIETVNFESECIIGDKKYTTVHKFPIDTSMSYIEEYINEALDFQIKCIDKYGINIKSDEITWDIDKYYKAKGNFDDSDEDVKIMEFINTFNISKLHVQYKNEDIRYNWNNTWEVNSSYTGLMTDINKYARENYIKVTDEIKNKESNEDKNKESNEDKKENKESNKDEEKNDTPIINYH
ncbi:MAG: DUF4446 family protein [Romboutsia sp.]|nr:DUF4446 family protein [Romboutsia sp.]